MSIIGKKVNRTINENQLTFEDIATRKEWRNKPGEENYKDLIFYNGWKHWTKEYSFLPVPDKFLTIREETLKSLENLPNEKKKEDKIFKIEYFLTRNVNNVINFVIQNPNSYDLLDPYNVLFFRKQLYFITSVDYINDKTLYCQITAERDLFWTYYGNVCK